MAKVPSYTYAGGVLGEGLAGRVDLNKYQTGLKYAHNFHIAAEGGAEKRFGMYFCGPTKFHDRDTRLISWKIANDDSYVMEFGHQYVRFLRFGGYVVVPDDHVPHPDSIATTVGLLEVTLPYADKDVADLKYTFANDVMRIFHPLHPELLLKRLGLYDWAVEVVNYDPHPNGPTGLTATYTDSTTVDDNYDTEPEPTFYKVSATLSNGIETKASGPVEVAADLGHRRTKVVVEWAALTGAVQYTVYKGQNGIYGFIGFTEELEYTDKNFAPSYDTVPVGAPIPFPTGEYPSVGEYYKQRLVRAAPLSETQGLWLSRPVVMNSLTGSIPSQDDDAIKVTLIGRQSHTIHFMMELKKFIIFTSSGEWVLGTFENQPMTPGSIDPTMETAYGIDPRLPPIAIGERILFVQGVTGDIRDMGYEFTSDAYKADDLSRLARHLFTNQRIVSWTYGAFPQNLLHCVLTSGEVRSMTYVREHEIWGWSTMGTQGNILDVEAVAEIDHDGVYFIVDREINGVMNRFVERTEVNFNGRIEDMVYVDSALAYKDERAFTELTRLSATQLRARIPDHDYEVGDEIALEIYHINKESREVLDREYRIVVDNIAGELVRGNLIRVGDEVEPILPGTTGRSLMCVNYLTGYSHLGELTPIWVLADGKVLKNLVVGIGGSLSLPFYAARVIGGLPYEAELETLDLDAGDAAGTYVYRAVNDIAIRLRNSRAVWAGPAQSPRELSLIAPRDQEDYYQPNKPLDGAYIIPAHTAWDLTCRVRVESRDPLPCNVLNIVPDLVYGT